MKKIHIAILSILLFSNNSIAQTLTSESLLKDFQVLKAVIMNYHPGLNRYQDKLTIEGHFSNLQKQLNRDLSLGEAYLAFSKFTASIKCGHTFCSFYNQNGQTKDSLFNKSDKVPFTFYLFEKRMFIEKNLSDNEELIRGLKVSEISNLPVASIIDTLIQYVKGDGSRES